MNETFSQHSGTILREDRLGLFTRSPFLPVHFHWTTTLDSGKEEGYMMKSFQQFHQFFAMIFENG